jgi:hypothetical protein
MCLGIKRRAEQLAATRGDHSVEAAVAVPDAVSI